jgi:hypothetical protein
VADSGCRIIRVSCLSLTLTVFRVESSACGPFRHFGYPYGVILDVFQVTGDSNGFLVFIRFITKPGVIGFVLLVMW